MMFFKDKVVLITGGTGSFGNAFLKKLLLEDVKEVRIFSRDELKQNDMRTHYKDSRIKFFIGDVRDISSLIYPMKDVDYVFHAAALKQVPTCEFFPIEAVKTNILGTENVLNAAIDAKVKKVICLSTDKSVYPINAMGISKAMMEKLFIAKARMQKNVDTVICGTRYGNVMASRGSVIPLFIDQILAGQPMTITNPKMTRYLMDLDEACDLVLYAFEHGNQGDIFVKKSPSSTILDLAVALKEVFQSDVPINTIGTRHGEKLYESLLTSEEALSSSDLGDYFVVHMDVRDLNYGLYFDEGMQKQNGYQPYTSHNTKMLTVPEIKEILLSLDYVKERLKS